MNAQPVVVVGGGYVGLEVAATARQLGCEVAIVERLSRLLSRVTSQPVSQFYLNLHKQHRVDVLLGDSVDSILGQTSVCGVRLQSGRELDCTAVVVGIDTA